MGRLSGPLGDLANEVLPGAETKSPAGKAKAASSATRTQAKAQAKVQERTEPATLEEQLAAWYAQQGLESPAFDDSESPLFPEGIDKPREPRKLYLGPGHDALTSLGEIYKIADYNLENAIKRLNQPFQDIAAKTRKAKEDREKAAGWRPLPESE